jgi:predicted dehydrogenase
MKGEGMSEREGTSGNGYARRAVVSRREFTSKVAAAGAGISILPRSVLGRGFTAPSDLLNIAVVGIGNMGASNTRAVASENVVAVCDVDWGYGGKAVDRLIKAAMGGGRPGDEQPSEEERARMKADGRHLSEALQKMKRYQDYRKMLDQQKDIDAVIVATPDHMHAMIASAAMDLGKAVYVQKPLCWSVYEARFLARKAAEKKVVTQMGNQGHSLDDARKGVEHIMAGTIGEIREVHVWTNRPLGYWPQGLPRPEPLSGPSEKLPWTGPGVTQRLAGALTGNYPMPDQLAWDLFLGGSPVVDYHPVYHPHHWRGWVDWGQGALGDMGAHLVDHPFWALDLGYPTSVETISTPFNGFCYPHATTTYYQFPARGSMPPVKLTWYDGGLLPPKPEELGEDEKLNPGGGIMYVGSKGKMLQDTYGANPRFLPKSLNESAGTPPQKLPRIPDSHEMNWVNAVKGKTQASSPFEYASRLTEVMLLGVVSLRAGSKIFYDGANMRVTGPTAANEFLTREYRQGWKL